MPAPLKISKEEMEKAVLICIGIFVFVIAMLQFATFPSIRKLGELNTETGRLRENLKKSQSLITNKSQMESRLAVLRRKLKDYKTALPLYSDMPNILQDISKIASEAKVKIIKIEPLKGEQKPAGALIPENAALNPLSNADAARAGLIYAEVPIKVEAKGGYHSLGKFINDIETLKNIMAIGDLEVNYASDDMFSHNARLLIIAYVLREEMPEE